jgi:tetratricopeptide (TPR) repeat protein
MKPDESCVIKPKLPAPESGGRLGGCGSQTVLLAFSTVTASTPAVKGPHPSYLRGVGPAALVFIATVAAYLSSVTGAFIWNDSDYVTAPSLRSLAGLGRIWTEIGATQQYYPLLHSAFWLEHALWGDHPLGYHVFTIVLHAAAAVLFARVLRRLLNGASCFEPGSIPYPGAEWLAALIFALHPVHAESVAWISEQKNTLSLAFYLAAALAYLRFDEDRRPGDYLAALALFALSLLCKTVTSTLPAALLVALWWKRGRLGWQRDVRPLVPWFITGAAAGMFSSWVEKNFGGARGPEFDISFVDRALVAGRAVWSYAGRLAWPFGLNFIYPRWTIDAKAWWQWLFPLGVLAAAGGLWCLRRRARAPLAAFLFFVGSLFPVLGFVNLYGARYSWVWDHWQYLADLGPIALAAVGIAAFWRHAAPRVRQLEPAILAALILFLGDLTWTHCSMFHDDRTLYLENLERNPASWLAHNNLGCLLDSEPGEKGHAISEFEAALRLNPAFFEAHNNLGCDLEKSPGRMDDAIAQFREAIRLKPDYAEAHYNLGNALGSEGRTDESISEFRAALGLKPRYAQAHYNLANTLMSAGRDGEAIDEFQAAILAQPDYAEAQNNLGLALAKIPGRQDEAIGHFREAIRLNPNIAQAHSNLGNALATVPGKLDEAIAQYDEALRLNPDLAEAHFYLANALVQAGRIPDAIQQYGKTLEIQPDLPEASNNLGMLLCRTGHPQEGLVCIEAALSSKPDFVQGHLARGAALLQLGRKDDAVAEFERVLQLRPGDPSASRMMAVARSAP